MSDERNTSGDEPQLGGQPIDNSPGKSRQDLLLDAINGLADPDPQTRELAEQYLRREVGYSAKLDITNPTAVIEALRENPWIARAIFLSQIRYAGKELSLFAEPDFESLLIAIINTPIPDLESEEGRFVRSAQFSAIRLLSNFKTDLAFNSLVNRWSTANPHMRGDILESLNKFEDKDIAPFIIECLSWPEPRHEAIEILKKTDAIDSRIVPALIDLVLERFPLSEYFFAESSYRNEAIKILARSGDPRALPALIQIVDRAPSFFTYTTIGVGIEALATIGDPKMIRIISRHLGAEQEFVRNQARLALQEFGTLAVPELFRVLWDHSSVVARREALSALRMIDDRNICPQLMAYIYDADSEIQSAVIEHLGVEQYAPAFPQLLSIFETTTSRSLRKQIVTTFGMLNNGQAVPLLAQLAQSDDWAERTKAVESLVDLGEKAWGAIKILLLDEQTDNNLVLAIFSGFKNKDWEDPRLLEIARLFVDYRDGRVRRIITRHLPT